MALDIAIARPELLQVADAVAREKMIEREEVLEAMEQAMGKAGRAKYGHEKDIRAHIDRKDGKVTLTRWTEVVEAEPEDLGGGVVLLTDLAPRRVPLVAAGRRHLAHLERAEPHSAREAPSVSSTLAAPPLT